MHIPIETLSYKIKTSFGGITDVHKFVETEKENVNYIFDFINDGDILQKIIDNMDTISIEKNKEHKYVFAKNSLSSEYKKKFIEISKKIIQEHPFESLRVLYKILQLSNAFMDYYLLSRLLKTFKVDEYKEIYEKKAFNSIIFVGDIHAKMYEMFLNDIGFKTIHTNSISLIDINKNICKKCIRVPKWMKQQYNMDIINNFLSYDDMKSRITKCAQIKHNFSDDKKY